MGGFDCGVYNFRQHCAISALQISKKHFATFDIFVKMKLVSTHWDAMIATFVCRVESFQDFLIKLDMKPRMHLVEISIFPLNKVTIRLTK
jgi:hypothetical protein